MDKFVDSTSGSAASKNDNVIFLSVHAGLDDLSKEKEKIKLLPWLFPYLAASFLIWSYRALYLVMAFHI